MLQGCISGLKGGVKMARILSLMTLQRTLEDELKAHSTYSNWFKETGNKKFQKMAQEERGHARIIADLLRKRV